MYLYIKSTSLVLFYRYGIMSYPIIMGHFHSALQNIFACQYILIPFIFLIAE